MERHFATISLKADESYFMDFSSVVVVIAVIISPEALNASFDYCLYSFQFAQFEILLHSSSLF